MQICEIIFFLWGGSDGGGGCDGGGDGDGGCAGGGDGTPLHVPVLWWTLCTSLNKIYSTL